MTKSIILELPEWANWIAQDEFGPIRIFKYEPDIAEGTIFKCDGISKDVSRIFVTNLNWRESKINLNTHGAYISADGILHRCELVPDMLRRQV